MRTVGLAVLGLFCGLFAGFVVNEIVAYAVLGATGSLAIDGSWQVALRAVVPVLGVAGALVALVVDRRRHRSRAGR